MYKVENVWKDWRVTRLIGEGSFGKVYEIVRNNFGIEEHSALKVITIPTSTAEVQSFRNEGMDENSVTEYYRGLVRDFVQEIALMSKLKGNPGIVAYEDYAVLQHQNDIGWDILIRMELLHPLPELMRNHNLTENEVVDLGISMCEALSICHSNSIIHRDIKLDNIFISDNGYYKLGDFGVARTIEKTVSGLSKKGTYTYMAPEVYKGETYGCSVDIYSLGMVMYRLLNFNREPFLPLPPENIKYNDKNEALVKRMQGQNFAPPANASEQLSKIIMKACSFEPQNRFSSSDEMKRELEKIKIDYLKTKSNPEIIRKNDCVVDSDKTENSSAEDKTVSAFGTEHFEREKSLKSQAEYSNNGFNADKTQSTFGAERCVQEMPAQSEFVEEKFDVDKTQSVFASDRFHLDDSGNNSFNPSNYSGNVTPGKFGESYNCEGTVSAFNSSDVSNNTYGNKTQLQNNDNSGKITASLVLGWIGAFFEMVIFNLFPTPIIAIPTIVIVVGMILLSTKKYSTALWVIMLIVSIGSLAVLNLISILIIRKVCLNKNGRKQ